MVVMKVLFLFLCFVFICCQNITCPTINTLSTFSVLGAATVTNTGSTVVNGDLGLYPGTSVTGFPPGIVTGTQHITDTIAQQAQSDASSLKLQLSAFPCTFNYTGTPNIGGLTLIPGVYCFDSSASITGTLTLNGLGNSNPFWIFNIGSTLITASSSSLVFINTASLPCNVFWNVGSSATLGSTSLLFGIIVAQASITLDTGASLNGKALALTGAVTLDTNQISNCTTSCTGTCCTKSTNYKFYNRY
jgi:hypothetical protein